MLFAEIDFWLSFFANLPAAILAMGSFVGVILSHMKQTAKIEKIESQTNGLAKALVKEAGDKGFEAGQRGEENPTIHTAVHEAIVLDKEVITKLSEETAVKVVEKLKDARP